MIRVVSIPTEAGEFVAHFSERGLAAIDFPERKRVESRRESRVLENRFRVPPSEFRVPSSEFRVQKTRNPERGTRNRDSEPGNKADHAELRLWEQLTANALRAALAGKSAGRLPPFDWRSATEFQQSIWRALLRIPIGRTSTYAALAAAAGHPRAVRAAGSACGANPIPVLVPCHRVVASGGGLGGFGGGLDWKRRLLEREGVQLIT